MAENFILPDSQITYATTTGAGEVQISSPPSPANSAPVAVTTTDSNYLAIKNGTYGVQLSGSNTWTGAQTFSSTVNIGNNSVLQIGGTTVIDASRNITASSFNGTLYGSMNSSDTRNVNDNPQDIPSTFHVDFKANSTNGLSDGGSYNGVMTFRKYGSGTDFSGGPVMQLAYTDNANLWMRLSNGNTSWTGWYKFYHTGNLGNVTGSTNGIMLSTDKTKLDGIASGAQVNQNAFSNIVAGGTTLSSTSTTDTLTLSNGNGITITGSSKTASIANTYAVVSDTQPSTGLFDGMLWYAPTAQTTQFYLNGAFRQVASSGNSNTQVITITNSVTLASASASASIGITQYSKGNDTLMVYQNSTYLPPSLYTVSVDSTTVTLNSGTWASGTELDFVVLKNSATQSQFVDGSVIDAGSIQTSSLASQSTSATANTIAVRDGSGNLTASTFNGNISGGSANFSGLVTASADFNNSSITLPTYTTSLNGMTLGWNYTKGTGEADIFVYGRGGSGGLNIYNTNNSANGTMTKIWGVDSGGNTTNVGSLTVSGALNANGGIAMNRQAIRFNTISDNNHWLYNNYTNIDGTGAFDGIRWRTYAGMQMNIGDYSALTKALYVENTGTSTAPIAKVSTNKNLVDDGTGLSSFVKVSSPWIYVSSGATDGVNNSPWYGIGSSNYVVPNGGTSNGAVQVGGYFGLHLVTSGGYLDIANNGNANFSSALTIGGNLKGGVPSFGSQSLPSGFTTAYLRHIRPLFGVAGDFPYLADGFNTWYTFANDYTPQGYDEPSTTSGMTRYYQLYITSTDNISQQGGVGQDPSELSHSIRILGFDNSTVMAGPFGTATWGGTGNYKDWSSSFFQFNTSQHGHLQTAITGNVYSSWVASTAYAVGALVQPTTANGIYYKCTTAGTSGTAQPTWPTASGGTVTDGTVVWTVQGSQGNVNSKNGTIYSVWLLAFDLI